LILNERKSLKRGKSACFAPQNMLRFTHKLTKTRTNMNNFQYKSKNRVFQEFKECKDIFAKLDYAKQLKKDQYDYYYDIDLDSVIRKLQNLIVINY